MASNPQLTQQGDVLYLHGDVTFSTVPALYAQLQKRLDNNIRTLDLNGVNATDSSAISLLLSCQEMAREIHITGASDAIVSLVSLYGVAGFMAGGLSGRTD